MYLFQRIRRFFLTSSLALLLATVITFGFGTANSLAATTSLSQIIHQSSPQLAFMNRVETMGKNIEGKTQEAVGNITGNSKDQMMGKAKQVESQVQNAAEDAKENMKLKGRAKAVERNLAGKTQEGIGNLTGDRQDQLSGQAKQVESHLRNAVEDVKDTAKNIFN